MRKSFLSLNSVSVFACLAALLAAILAFAPAAAWAQATSTGTIFGVVIDNTNAVVPGATVTITQKATGSTRSSTTNNVGRYVFVNVDPGSYDVKVEKQNFQTTVVSNQVVQVGTQLTVNAVLQVGATTTTVEVTATPGAELQTLNATVGSTLSGAIITNLPNVSRDASTLAVLQPGQNINGNTGGVETDQNSFQLDGGFATDDMSGDNNTYIASFGSDTAGGAGQMHSAGFTQAPSAVVPIPVSSVEEFKVSTSNQTADFNGGAGSQMQIVTKRGTNAFHGGVYDYYLDSTFAGANTWDNNASGRKLASSHFSRFGADAGGKIPHSNFAGGSWFIFGNYEGFRFPQSSTFVRNFPLPSMRAGLLKLNGEVINLNPVNTTDPGTTNTYQANGATCVNAAGCAGGTIPVNTFIPCTGAGGCNARGLGLNPVICTPTSGTPDGTCAPGSLWSLVPLPNNLNQGDRLNYAGYDGNIKTPQSSNFGVARIDHDFAKNEHFNATYHYYKLTKTVADQWDVGGFFPGDTPGQYSAIRHKPQQPWLYTAGLTTDVSSNVTNNVHFSYTRNWWAYGDPSGVPNLVNYPAALELGGETSGVFGPYNTNNQSTRTRYWNGHDALYADDVTWIKGNHLFQFGGSYLRNRDTHNRNDNGGTINTFEQYLIGEGNGVPLSSVGIDMSGYIPAGITSQNKYGNLYSMVLGMVDGTQSLYSRGLGSRITGLPLNPRPTGDCAISGIAATTDCTNSPPLTNSSIIPTYNVYLTDSWHMKPTVSLNYGMGYTVEMPPYETGGGVQTVMVDGNDNIMRAQQYLNNEKQAALQGLAYAPLIGFATVRNVAGHSTYPYDPYFAGFSPRIGIAWNIRPDTVIRGGFARIFGRINGVDPVLVPMLTPGLLQPATCNGPIGPAGGALAGSCGGGTPANVFRVGNDCPATGPCFAPLPQPSINASGNQPQPWYPGFNDVATGPGETIDANFHPNRSDEITFSVQHQFGPKILAEGGYIGRMLTNEVQYYSLTNVPYMMTQGGQTFGDAWKNIMVATNYGTTNLTTVPSQPFFEKALGGTGSAYCGATSCTAAFVANHDINGSALMFFSDPFDAWAATSNAGAWTFGRSFTSDPIQATCPTGPTGTVTFGCNGQSPSVLTEFSNGYGNYNGGYLQLTFTDWHGLTMKTNFSMAKALGTGNVVQASSSFASLDPWNIRNNYGLQSYDEKYTFNLFLNYASPYYASQKGVVGRLLGGWSISPLFVWGSGFPQEVNTSNADCGSLGACNTAFVGSFENGVFNTKIPYSPKRHQGVFGDSSTGCGTAGGLTGQNVFPNPDTGCPANGGTFLDPVRNPILGLDGQDGGFPLYGLSLWNLDMAVTKKVNIMEKLSGSLYFNFSNVLNHMQANDPSFNLGDPTSWGVLGGGGNVQGNFPRSMQIGFTIDW
ncbi:MAG TPA: carboxypeptidase-like regulatory domain-containing protein [Candidatus Acidoferrales bacterium]|nr:carboxypeptidase-like regulatory domain-containing protein [Candidatus Acidoferrales bacterium]